DGDGDQAFGGHAARLLGGGGQALGAQPVDRPLQVAVGFRQRLLAVHHARTGLLAQFLAQRRGDLNHPLPLFHLAQLALRDRMDQLAGAASASWPAAISAAAAASSITSLAFSLAPRSAPRDVRDADTPSRTACATRSQ